MVVLLGLRALEKVLLISLSVLLGDILLMFLWGAGRVAAERTDGSLVEDKVSGASSAGSGCFTCRCSHRWDGWRWGHLDEDVGDDAVVSACRCFCSVPGPLQSVQRAEFWSVILALQANDGVHLVVDNLGVVRHVGRLLDGKTASRPAELVKDGDLVLLIERMLHLRGLDTVRISRVKGHAEEALVRAGRAGRVIMELMRLPTLVVGGCLGGLLMLAVIILVYLRVGARLSSSCIGFLLPLPGLLSIMVVWPVLLGTLWFRLRVMPLSVVHAVLIGPFCLGLLESGMGNGCCCCDSCYFP